MPLIFHVLSGLTRLAASTPAACATPAGWRGQSDRCCSHLWAREGGGCGWGCALGLVSALASAGTSSSRAGKVFAPLRESWYCTYAESLC